MEVKSSFIKKYKILIIVSVLVVVAGIACGVAIPLLLKKPNNGEISCPLPLPLSLSSPAWGCNGTISGAKVGNHVSCTYRCGQGGLAGLAQCKGTDWVPQISTVLDCHYNDTEVFNFFDAEDQDSFTNPPEDSFFDPSSMLFTSPQYGLYLFGITAASNDVTLQTQTGVLANMHSDSGTSSSLVITLLKQEDTIQASYQDSEGLHFLGTSLHSLGGSVPYVSGTASGHLGVEDAPQNIIMTEYSQNGEHLTYDESSGCIQVMEEGDYLMGLTLSSKGSSIASLKVDDVTLGLGDDTQGQGMMSNSAIMHLNEGACIVPQLEPLSQIYEGDKWSQLFLTSIPAGGSGDAFCYALSQPIFNEYPKQVSFDVPLLSNPHFNSGIFSIPDYEEFNPRRFYLVLVNAFMASGTLTLELGDSQGNWEAVGKGHTATTDRRMVTVRKIVEMDNFKNMIRIKASGLLDEGDSHFATFCGMRIGK